MNPELDLAIYFLAMIVIILFAAVLISALVMKIRGFMDDLDFINREIGRTTGGEQQHWIREKRRLWLSLLPFYRR